MRRLAALVFLLVAPAALAQQAAPSPPAERWFAIAVERGTQRHLGPFPSLEACDTARQAPAAEFEAKKQQLGVSTRFFLLGEKDPGKLAAQMEYINGVAAIEGRYKDAPMWRDLAICERK